MKDEDGRREDTALGLGTGGRLRASVSPPRAPPSARTPGGAALSPSRPLLVPPPRLLATPASRLSDWLPPTPPPFSNRRGAAGTVAAAAAILCRSEAARLSPVGSRPRPSFPGWHHGGRAHGPETPSAETGQGKCRAPRQPLAPGGQHPRWGRVVQPVGAAIPPRSPSGAGARPWVP